MKEPRHQPTPKRTCRVDGKTHAIFCFSHNTKPSGNALVGIAVCRIAVPSHENARAQAIRFALNQGYVFDSIQEVVGFEGVTMVTHRLDAQSSPDDPTRICPCCGWREAVCQKTELPDSAVFGIKIVTVRWAIGDDNFDLVGKLDEITAFAEKHEKPNAMPGAYVAYLPRPYTGPLRSAIAMEKPGAPNEWK